MGCSIVSKTDDMSVFYKEDIQIAIAAMKESLLYPDSEIIYDLYAIPSHNQQSFYAVIYRKNDEYEMVYAKTAIYHMLFDEPIRMYPFSDAQNAKSKANCDGRIIVGISKLDDSFVDRLSDVIVTVPAGYYYDNELFMLDGVFQVVRSFSDGAAKEIIYENTGRIPSIDDQPEIKDFLENMYLFVGKIISH